MVGGLIALVVVLAVASAAGFALRQRQGRFRPVLADQATVPANQPTGQPASGAGPETQAAVTQAAVTQAAVTQAAVTQAKGTLSEADLGAPLGPRATLVQFSTQVCAYCGPTRQLLTEVAAQREGVSFVEIDAADRMDLTRRLRVLSTPTVLVLDPAGGITSRASGPVRKADLLAAVGNVLAGDGAVLADGGAPQAGGGAP